MISLSSIPLSHLLPAIAVAGVLAYWEIRELLTSRADTAHGGYPRLIRLLIRLIMPIVGLLLILQLLGVITARLPVLLVLEDMGFVIGQALLWFGVALSIWARETLGRHWAHAAEYQLVSGQKLVTSGPYRYVRHPIYTALLMIFIGTQLIVFSWLIVLAIPFYWYISWQASREEKLLQTEFGDQYGKYTKRTGRIVPKM